MVTGKQLKEWAAGLEDDRMIGTDDGGLVLIVLDPDEYQTGDQLEVGHIPKSSQAPVGAKSCSYCDIPFSKLDTDNGYCPICKKRILT